MTETKITREFPEGKPRGLETETFRARLADMVEAYVSFLSGRELKTRPRTIIRPHNGGMVWIEISFPDYPPWLEADEYSAALKLVGVAAFFDYVWERGELHRSFTGPNPSRTTWETSLLVDVLHVPLMGLLTYSALRQAIQTGVVSEQWTLPSDLTDRFLNELVKRYCNGRQTYIARCPLAWISLPTGSSIDFGSGMVLQNYTPTEHALYLSQNYNRILWHDSISQLIHSDIAVLELTGEIECEIVRMGKSSKIGDDVVKESIADALDVLKWAMVTVLERNSPPIEGTITYTGPFGEPVGLSGVGSFRRQNKSYGTLFNFDEDATKKIRGLVRAALDWREKSADIHQAFWHWGRAALTDLYRDRLLESIIGLERLLVSNSGESRYRFGLHGAALLASTRNDTINTAKQLRKFYDRRSSAAHGSIEEPYKESVAAHKSFGDTIRVILQLYKQGALDPNKRIADQLEQHVLRNAWLTRGEGL